MEIRNDKRILTALLNEFETICIDLGAVSEDTIENEKNVDKLLDQRDLIKEKINEFIEERKNRINARIMIFLQEIESTTIDTMNKIQHKIDDVSLELELGYEI